MNLNTFRRSLSPWAYVALLLAFCFFIVSLQRPIWVKGLIASALCLLLSELMDPGFYKGLYKFVKVVFS